MTFIIADRVKESTTTTGTGTLTLAGAATGFRAFSAVCANNDTVAYAVSSSGSEWETGLGTWTTGNNLARTTVIASSNANAAVSFSAGTKDVYLTMLGAQVETSAGVCGGRLTLTTGVPVTTSDVTGATTVYFTPYRHNEIALYTGGMWRVYRAAELSEGVGTITSGANYDEFIWDNAGTLTMTKGPAWTGDNTRGTGAGTTELELFEGVYVNKVSISGGPGVRAGRYVGTFRTTSTTTTADSELNRFLANLYNPALRIARQIDQTSHAFASLDRIWRGGTQTRCFWVQAFAGWIDLYVNAQTTSASTVNAYINPSLNGTNVNGGLDNAHILNPPGTGNGANLSSQSAAVASVGYNFADVGEAEFSGNNVTFEFGRTLVELWQ